MGYPETELHRRGCLIEVSGEYLETCSNRQHICQTQQPVFPSDHWECSFHPLRIVDLPVGPIEFGCFSKQVKSRSVTVENLLERRGLLLERSAVICALNSGNALHVLAREGHRLLSCPD